jgi:hypothetical protein
VDLPGCLDEEMAATITGVLNHDGDSIQGLRIMIHCHNLPVMSGIDLCGAIGKSSLMEVSIDSKDRAILRMTAANVRKMNNLLKLCMSGQYMCIYDIVDKLAAGIGSSHLTSLILTGLSSYGVLEIGKCLASTHVTHLKITYSDFDSSQVTEQFFQSVACSKLVTLALTDNEWDGENHVAVIADSLAKIKVTHLTLWELPLDANGAIMLITACRDTKIVKLDLSTVQKDPLFMSTLKLLTPEGLDVAFCS